MIQPPAAPLPSFSIVIEWDNMRRARMARAAAMLAALDSQLREVAADLPGSPRLVIVFDPAAVSQSEVARVLGPQRTPGPPIDIAYVPTPGLGYYDMKNRGAQHGRGEVIVFLDSDVVPEAGWLRRLLQSFADPAVDMAAGATAMATDTFLGRAFALFWFFPLRPAGERVLETADVFANNMAVRRTLFLARPFPEQANYRGQCIALARGLRAAGHGVFLVEGARVTHPPTHGAAHFVQRALRHGHDRYLDAVAAGQAPLAACWRQAMSSLGQAWHRFRHHRQEIGLSLIGGIAALVLAACYYALALVGAFIGQWWPDLLPRRFAH